MKHQDIEKLIDKNKYQVFLFASPPHLPFFFARHPWFVINKKGEIARWEILFKKNCCEKSINGHLHVDGYPLTRGMGLLPVQKKLYWKSNLLKYIEGDENSSAKKMIDFIENSKNTYPYCQKYSLLGPNSNTYIEWVLGNFPEFNIKLPWNYIGKNYKG